MMLGLLFPGTILLARYFLDNRIYHEKDIQKITKTPFLGTIAASKKKQRIVVQPKSRSGIAEMFRLLRTNLLFLAGQDQKLLYLVTSARSGEGKTFVSINLGMSFAIFGQKNPSNGFGLAKTQNA